MLPLAIASTVLTVLATVALVLAERANNQRGVWVAKPLASLGFNGVALALGGLDTIYGSTLLVGLGLCSLGDVLLIPRGTKAWFMLGVVCFALGHAAFAVAFARYGIHDRATMIALVPMAIIAILTLRWVGPHLPVLMQAPMRMYIAVISVMVAFAAGASMANNQWLLLLGATLFATSDLSVARERFIKADFINQAWGLPMYFAAQLILAWTVLTTTG